MRKVICRELRNFRELSSLNFNIFYQIFISNKLQISFQASIYKMLIQLGTFSMYDTMLRFNVSLDILGCYWLSNELCQMSIIVQVSGNSDLFLSRCADESEKVIEQPFLLPRFKRRKNYWKGKLLFQRSCWWVERRRRKKIEFWEVECWKNTIELSSNDNLFPWKWTIFLMTENNLHAFPICW